MCVFEGSSECLLRVESVSERLDFSSFGSWVELAMF